MIYIKCPTCTTTLSVQENQAGTLVLCPNCKTKLIVPGNAPVPAATNVLPSSANTTQPKAAPKAPPRKPAGELRARCFSCKEAVPVTEDPPEYLPMCDKCRRGFTSRGLKRPFCIRINSEILRWPSFCACCGKRTTSIKTISFIKKAHTRTSIDKERKSWDIPYCFHCLEHTKLQEHAATLMSEAKEEAEKAVKKYEGIVEVPTSFKKPLFWSVFWGLAVTLFGVIAFNPLLLGVLFPRASQASLGSSWFNISTVFFLVGVLLGGFVWFLMWQRGRKQSEERMDKAEKRVKRARTGLHQAQTEAGDFQERARTILQPTCCSLNVAVHYTGWQGYTHVFYLDNESYAVAVVTMNRGVVVEPSLV